MKKGLQHTDRRTTFHETLMYYTLVSFTLISLLIFFGYGLFNLWKGVMVIGFFEVMVAFILASTLYFVIKKKIFHIPGTINIIVFQIMAVYLFMSGGVANSGIFWIFLFPITYYFFKGSKIGSIWFFLQLTLMTLIFLFSKLDYCSVSYTDIYFFVSAMVLIIEAIVLYIHERITEENLDHIKKLRGLLPICSVCKKIRDDEGYWNTLEIYIKEHSDAEFTHSLCPDCTKKIYPELMDKKD